MAGVLFKVQYMTNHNGEYLHLSAVYPPTQSSNSTPFRLFFKLLDVTGMIFDINNHSQSFSMHLNGKS